MTAFAGLAVLLSTTLSVSGAASAAPDPRPGATPPPTSAKAPSGSQTTPPFTTSSRIITGQPGGKRGVQISIGGATFASPALNGPCGSAVWVQALDRSTLTPISSRVYALCTEADTAQLLKTLSALTTKVPKNNPIVVLNSISDGSGRADSLTGLDAAVQKIGVAAGAFASVDLGGVTFSAVGVAGTQPGQSYYAFGRVDEEKVQAPASAGRATVKGLLDTDSQDLFALSSLDFTNFSIADTGAMTVAGVSYAVPTVGGRQATNGFHLLVLDRKTLQPVVHEFYATADDLQQQFALQDKLAGVRQNYGTRALVMLASVGLPINTNNLLPAAPGPAPAGCTRTAFRESCTFTYTGTEQRFTVPQGAFPGDLMTIELNGGRGGDSYFKAKGGAGAKVVSSLPIAEDGIGTLYIEVGGNGTAGGYRDAGAGGWNGGGDGNAAGAYDTQAYPSGGGGGSSDVRTISRDSSGSLESRILVAAGGAGAGGDTEGTGGTGGNGGAGDHDGLPGGAPGNKTPATPGGAGTLLRGGTGGDGAVDGTLGSGGKGADSYSTSRVGRLGAGGGGGGGVYGGGGGGHFFGQGNYGGSGGGGGASKAGGGTVTTSPDAPSVTITTPTPWGPTLAEALRYFDATPTVVDGRHDEVPNYRLVGVMNPSPDLSTPNPVRAAETAMYLDDRATGELQGVLRRGRDDMQYATFSWDAPRMVSIANGPFTRQAVNYEIYSVLAQAPQSWPVPDPQAPNYAQQQKAYADISVALCRCADVRQTYTGAFDNTLVATLDKLKYDPSKQKDYDQQTFGQVKSQLGVEFLDLQKAWDIYNQMNTLLISGNSKGDALVHTAFTNVRKDVSPPSNTMAMDVFRVLISIISLGVSGTPNASASVGVFGALVGLGFDASKDAAGNQLSLLAAEVSQLEVQAVTQYDDATNQLDHTWSYLISDWGRLQRTANDKDAIWGIKLADQPVLIQAMQNRITVNAYASLMGAAYHVAESGAIVALPPPSDVQDPPPDQLTTVCQVGYYDLCNKDPMYQSIYLGDILHYPTHPASAGFQQRNAVLFVWQGDAEPDAPGTGLKTALTNAGVSRADLFLRWPMWRSYSDVYSHEPGWGTIWHINGP